MTRIMTIQAIALAGGIYLPLGGDELWKYKERCDCQKTNVSTHCGRRLEARYRARATTCESCCDGAHSPKASQALIICCRKLDNIFYLN